MIRRIYGVNEGTTITTRDGGWEGGGMEDLGSSNGRHFYSVEDVTLASLPDQDPANGFALATAAEIAALKPVSPVVGMVKNEINAEIRKKYSLDDELQALRLGNTDVQADIAVIVESGKTKLAALGF